MILVVSIGGILVGFVVGVFLVVWEIDFYGICVVGDVVKLNVDVCCLIDDLNGIIFLLCDVIDCV